MTPNLKKVHEQVIVITGASSGIGLCTARMAASRGARVVLAARSGESLRELVQEISSVGGLAVSVVADVSRQEDVRGIARVAQERFGGFDTWVNNAATGMYGKIEATGIDDMRKLFETNFWGLVYGSLEAVAHLKTRGGALINVGSTVSDRAVPLQGIYASSKHAVKGFTDTLRMELEDDGAPISVTLVKPGAIDTPFTLNARNYLETEPKHVPPVYAPETVARAILYCAENPVRDVFAGGGGKSLSAFGYHAPRLTDTVMRRKMIPGTRSAKPPRPRERNGLDQPSGVLRERGDYEGHVSRTSLYTEASLRPGATGAVVAGVGVIAGTLWWVISGRRSRP
jgi:short-subunit dehydrogenase